MSANSYTTTDLVNDILLLGHVPTGNNTFTPAGLLRLATMELQLPIAKMILSTRGGYYLTYTDYTVAADGLYMIPEGAVAGALANVELVVHPTIIPVSLIEESEQYSAISPSSTSYGFFMRGNYVQILPTPNVGVARLWFLKRTSTLVTVASCAQVTAIDLMTNTVTVSALPSTMIVGTTIDSLGDQPPFNILASGTITGINMLDVTLDVVSPDLVVGDWLALSEQTCIPQIPVEFRLLLAQRVVVKIYELQGYLQKMQAAMKKMEEYEAATLNLISSRVQSKTKVINPVNGGFLSGNPNKMTNFPAGRIS